MEVVTKLKSAVWCHPVKSLSESSQLIKFINAFARTLQTNQPNRDNNEKNLSKGARPNWFLRVSERFSRDTRYRNRSY